MRIGSIATVVGLTLIPSLASADPVSTGHRHHHVRITERPPPRQFVFQSPASAETTVFAGKFAGYMLPGIMGATTADPYEHPGYGYYVGGGAGPGYLYDDR